MLAAHGPQCDVEVGWLAAQPGPGRRCVSNTVCMPCTGMVPEVCPMASIVTAVADADDAKVSVDITIPMVGAKL